SGLGFKTHAWVLFNVEKEQGELGGCMNVVVVLELGIGEEFIPVILALVAEEVEVLLQLLVHMLYLAIRLQVVGSGGVRLYFEQSVELPGKLCHKLWPLVKDITLGEAVEFPDVPLVQVCSAHSRAGGVSWIEVCSLAEQVQHYHHCIVTVSIREFHNEGYRCYALLFCRHR
ncbi:hypothetical protein J132_09523, partial [Termitomyces sp. J132]